ncbi:MAG: PrsW family intramembrane metalloprotease [Deltaproteobacteria bacterium]|nr:PrsW family intramembrane metalloprotease [Deltaproteobacteria bacterium]
MLASLPTPSRRPDVGIALYVTGMLLGVVLLLLVFLVPSLFSRNRSVELEGLFVGASLAVPMLLVYVSVPWLLDRYDPEPIWALAMALAWGAIAACGVAAFVNTSVHLFGDVVGGPAFGKALSSCVSAPLVEEGMKGAFLFFMFRWMRSRFDGVVDGVIYGTFVALGFACMEDVIYYGHAFREQVLHAKSHQVLVTFIVRGVITPWGHPLYTSMTGIGFGIARETHKPWLRWLAPIGGYALAVFLHFVWNGSATISGFLFIVMLPLWFLFVLAFFGLVVYLVRRKGLIIRDHLRDEVMFGNLTHEELALIASPIGRIRATFAFGGRAGRRFVDAAARLGLCKWHATRAASARAGTASFAMLMPLRNELRLRRHEAHLARSARR